MRANDYQVSGRHYKTSYEHWDMCLKLQLGYLEGSSTKYVCRWRAKGGLTDLRKALHFLNKTEEDGAPPKTRPLFYKETIQEVTKFSTANKLSDIERAYIAALATWETKDELNGARVLLMILIDEAEALDKGLTPVPLTEENKHADRAPDGDGW